MWLFRSGFWNASACSFGVITALALEHVEASKAGEDKH